MEESTSTGVKGYFEDFEKKLSLPTESLVPSDDNLKPKETPTKKTARGGKESKKRARTGRPPGIPSGSRSEKQKATMHIDATLMDFYRDWSWEERCNLGELIERAMVSYKESRRSAPNMKKSGR